MKNKLMYRLMFYFEFSIILLLFAMDCFFTRIGIFNFGLEELNPIGKILFSLFGYGILHYVVNCILLGIMVYYLFYLNQLEKISKEFMICGFYSIILLQLTVLFININTMLAIII